MAADWLMNMKEHLTGKKNADIALSWPEIKKTEDLISLCQVVSNMTPQNENVAS